MKPILSTQPFAGGVRATLLLFSLIAALATAPDAAAADPALAEMLELGIYSEETKGDLDAAMKLYTQIVAEAEADQALAAQAQFRLATCLHKSGDYAAATAAFEKLVREFPQQTEVVTLANEYLAKGNALLPVPWPASEQFLFEVRFVSGYKIGSRLFSITSDQKDGRHIWRFTSNMLHNMHALSRVEVDAESFRPIRSHWTILPFGAAKTTYDETGATVNVEGKEEPSHVPMQGAVYDNEQFVHLVRRLPLALGYKTQLKVFASLTGGTVVPIELEVAAVETLTVPAGTFECYKITSNIGQTFWYSTSGAHEPVRYEEGNVHLNLVRITHHANDAVIRHDDPAFGLSFAAPAAWLVSRKEPPEEKHASNWFVVDDLGQSIGGIEVDPLDRMPEAARSSPRAFAEHELEEISKQVKDFSVRDTWTETTLAGQPAWTVVFEGKMHDRPRVTRAVFGFVDDKAVEIWAACQPKEYDGFMPKFDALVASVRAD